MSVFTLRQEPIAVALDYAREPARWPVSPHFDPARRWYHRLAAHSDQEVWLLTWLPGQHTDLHDHGGSAGAFAVVQGHLAEQTVVNVGDRTHLRHQRLAAGAARGFGSGHVHRIVNDRGVPAVSVHVYRPALATMTRYQLDGGSLIPLGVDLAGVQW